MKKKLLAGGFCFIIAAGLTFFGVQFFTKTGLFKIPGKLVFADMILDSEASRYEEACAELELEKDVVFSEFYSFDTSDALLVDVVVPVADFYEPMEGITTAEFEARLASNEGVVSILKLDSTMKLLSVDDNYYLDSFDSGAEFKYLRIEGENNDDVLAVSSIVKLLLPAFPDADSILTFTQTGTTALSRGMNAKMSVVGDGTYFSANIKDYFSKFDFVHTSNEASFSNYASSSNICADWRFLDTLTSIGLNIVELTGNHNVDCGADDANATFEKYQELSVKTVGGGRNATEAEVPLQISQKGTSITMLAYNESTGGATTGDYPGANKYSADNARARINEAKERGDFVIVDVQYNECNYYDNYNEDTTCDRADSAVGDQVGLFRSLIDMGADVVVGTSAHQTQTFERYGEGAIYYGLGNLFFDQIWWPGTTRSLGITHYFWNGKLLQTRRFGTVYDANYQTRIMNREEIEWFINRLNQAR